MQWACSSHALSFLTTLGEHIILGQRRALTKGRRLPSKVCQLGSETLTKGAPLPGCVLRKVTTMHIYGTSTINISLSLLNSAASTTPLSFNSFSSFNSSKAETNVRERFAWGPCPQMVFRW